jgi:hypothetical protein
MWCAISSAGIVEPDFLDDAVNAECYLKLLQEHLVPTLQGMGVNMEGTFFQQCGARSYMVNTVVTFPEQTSS